jgi:hypothetical protein
MQVMANLLSNAAKFSPPGADIKVTLDRHEGGLRIAVQDFGPGIPVEFRRKVFDRFAQADTSDSKKLGGTGLGLSIVKLIVERMLGTIGFTSEVGAGTVFFVDLPEQLRVEHRLVGWPLTSRSTGPEYWSARTIRTLPYCSVRSWSMAALPSTSSIRCGRRVRRSPGRNTPS